MNFFLLFPVWKETSFRYHHVVQLKCCLNEFSRHVCDDDSQPARAADYFMCSSTILSTRWLEQTDIFRANLRRHPDSRATTEFNIQLSAWFYSPFFLNPPKDHINRMNGCVVHVCVVIDRPPLFILRHFFPLSTRVSVIDFLTMVRSLSLLLRFGIPASVRCTD